MFARVSRASSAAPQLVARRAFARSPARAEIFHNASEETFRRAALESKGKTVLVDFYADWCRPCKMLQPILNKVAANEELNIDLVTVDTEALEEVAAKYQIRSLPTVFAFRDGEVVNKFIGMKNEKAVIEFVQASAK